jgi:SAM-dependent methyltransferase
MLETIPLSYSEVVPITNYNLLKLIEFVNQNPIYVESEETQVLDVPCRSYSCDVNEYWLSTKKYDSNYQPFYPTWMLSAYALALCTKSLGFKEIVDIGSGDGRIAYCAAQLGLRAIGIEIDSKLTELQQELSSITQTKYEIVNADATVFPYESLHLTKPMIVLSCLPEGGDMLANSIIPHVKGLSGLESCGFNLIGSHIMKRYSREFMGWGWGRIFDTYDLVIQKCVTLPTYWTNEQELDTAYIFAKSK